MNTGKTQEPETIFLKKTIDRESREKKKWPNIWHIISPEIEEANK